MVPLYLALWEFLPTALTASWFLDRPSSYSGLKLSLHTTMEK